MGEEGGRGQPERGGGSVGEGNREIGGRGMRAARGGEWRPGGWEQEGREPRLPKAQQGLG
jgi:hypothetical protein